MKNHTSIIFVLFLLFCSPLLQAQYTIIEGKIKLPAGQDANVTLVTDILKGDKVIFSTPVNYEGEFKLAFQHSAPTLVRFEHAYENLLIYIEPGDRMSLSFEAEKMWKTLKFEGDRANDNNYSVQYFNKFDKEVDQVYIDVNTETMEANAFRRYQDQVKAEKLQFYKAYCSNHSLSAGFDPIARADIDYNWGYDLLRFAEAKNWLLPASFYEFEKQLSIQNNAVLASNVYPKFVYTYCDYKAAMELQKDSRRNLSATRYYKTQSILTGEPLHYILATQIINGSMDQPIHELEPIYSDFILNNPYPHFNSTVQYQFEQAKKFAPGSPAPDFILPDFNGTTTSLSEFRGKTVYLAFWASWCGPCLQQIKHMKALKSELPNPEEVVFLYVSVDENEAAWRKTITDKAMPGIHVLSPTVDSYTPKQYNVAGVPVYFLIDPNGNFLSKPPPPSHKKQILGLIQKGSRVNNY